MGKLRIIFEDKELKRLFIEIVSMFVLLLVIVPVCVSASNDYNAKKLGYLNKEYVSVDISHNKDMKKVTIYSNYDKTMDVNLTLKISKFANEYDVYLDGMTYNIRDFECTEDEEWRYYRLGVFEVNRVREFDFKLQTKGSVYYEETIIYSFVTEGLL